VTNARQTIAIVDDDTAVRRALDRLLRGSGFDVTTFSSAEEFLARDTGDRPDCLLLDIHLDGMSGIDLHERLTQSAAGIPVVFITAHDDAATRQSLRDAPGVPCLRKPFDETLLFRAIQLVTGGDDTQSPPEGSSK
jgi:FixJ family two-component response regulator